MSTSEQQLASAATEVPSSNNNYINTNNNLWSNDDVPSQYSTEAPPVFAMAPTPNAVDPLPQQTRHARRLYVGNLPPHIREEQIHRVFRDAIQQALVASPSGEKPFDVERDDPILSVYINKIK
jgi:hypothetical protein